MTKSGNSNLTILVLDGNERSALASTRTLGEIGHEILVAEEHVNSLSASSRYCRREFVYPSPYSHPLDFLSWFTDLRNRAQFDVALPMTEVTTDLVTRHRNLWPELLLPFAPIDTIDALTDKVQLYSHALSLDIPVPTSVVVESSADLMHAIETIGFPAYIKPRRSRLWRNGAFLKTTVHKVDNNEQLLSLYQSPEFKDEAFLYQRPVSGRGCGVFALFDRGKPIAFFSHARLREKPPDGGVSVLSESRPLDQTLREYVCRLLSSVGWHGVAMVEFKGTSPSDAKLMEVNARFWGSLQLAIDAGVDFPRMLVDLARHTEPASPTDYRSGVKLRWLLGDLDRLYLVVRGPGRFPNKVKAVWDFLKPDPFRTRHEVFRWKDPYPALREALQYIRALQHSPSSNHLKRQVDAPHENR